MTNFEKMCAEGKPIFLSYDQTEMIRRFSLRSDEDWLYPVYLGEELRLNRHSGDLFYADGREAEGSVLLSVFDFLCRKSDPRPLTGRMFPSGSLPGYGTSRPDDIGLHAKHALALSGRVEPLRTLLRAMGGECGICHGRFGPIHYDEPSDIGVKVDNKAGAWSVSINSKYALESPYATEKYGLKAPFVNFISVL